MKLLFKKAITVGAVVTSAAFSASVFALDITGAGATFPYPIYASSSV
jgi:ABC-type phosphate transport system substrate-binding protein